MGVHWCMKKVRGQRCFLTKLILGSILKFALFFFKLVSANNYDFFYCCNIEKTGSAYGVEGTREQDFTERQDILTGPVQEKSTDEEGRPAGQRQSGAGAGKQFLALLRLIEQDQE